VAKANHVVGGRRLVHKGVGDASGDVHIHVFDAVVMHVAANIHTHSVPAGEAVDVEGRVDRRVRRMSHGVEDRHRC